MLLVSSAPKAGHIKAGSVGYQVWWNFSGFRKRGRRNGVASDFSFFPFFFSRFFLLSFRFLPFFSVFFPFLSFFPFFSVFVRFCCFLGGSDVFRFFHFFPFFCFFPFFFSCFRFLPFFLSSHFQKKRGDTVRKTPLRNPEFYLPGVVPGCFLERPFYTSKQGAVGNASESLGQKNGPRQDMRMIGIIVAGFRCGY